jgi:hypothetical protein
MIKETEDFGGGIYSIDTARGDPSLKVKWLPDETIEIIEQLKMARIQQQVVAFICTKFFFGQLVTNVNIVITSDKWTLL